MRGDGDWDNMPDTDLALDSILERGGNRRVLSTHTVIEYESGDIENGIRLATNQSEETAEQMDEAIE